MNTPKPWSRPTRPLRPPAPGNSGMVLFAAVALLGLLAALAFVVFMTTTIDFQISRNHVITQRAFEQAESGLHFAKSEIERELVAGRNLEEIAANFYVAPPAGFTFDPITQLTQLEDTNNYFFTVTGRSAEAQATLAITSRLRMALMVGVFGDDNVDTMPNISIFSYDADTFVGDPQPSDSTGEASTGSNDNLTIQPNVTVDGSLLIGEDEFGNTGTYPGGWDVEEVGRIEPDPLGIFGGELATRFAAVVASNDNAQSAHIVNNQLRLRNHGQIVLPAGNYYLTEVEIGNNSEVLADTSAGPVNIFLAGSFRMQPGGDLNTTGSPGNFRVFSNSSEQIQIKPKGDAKVIVYGPAADIQLYPIGHFYGVAWGKTVDMKPGGNVYIDTSLLRKIPYNQIIITSWKEVRR